MSLNEQLNSFKKQQVRCLSTISSIASSIQKPPLAAGPVKFSDDIERLQHINNIRKAPLGVQIKHVIDLLLETRLALTPEQINEVCHVDMHANKAVFDSIRKNPKAHYDGRRFSYKAEHDIKDKGQLLSLINRHFDGIADLKGSDDIYLISNSEEYIAYPNGLKLDIKVGDELKALYRNTEVPSDMLEVEKELRENGLKPATDTAARRAAAQMHGISVNNPTHKKKKKQEISKRTKITNVHIPELFQNLNASNSRN